MPGPATSAILVTGMSGTGKSTLLGELARRGFETVDTDYGGWITVVDGEPLWDVRRIADLLSKPRSGMLFVQGTVANQGLFATSFAAIVLLSAPVEVLLERLRTRTTNDFGKSTAERAKVARDAEEFEPLLRALSTHELDATKPVPELADELIAIAATLG